MSAKAPVSPPIMFWEASDKGETDESLQFYQAVGKSIAIWTRAEAELFSVYAAIAHPNGMPSGVSAAFHEIIGFRQRLSAVTALIRNTFYEPKYSELLKRWTIVRKLLNNTNKQRNKLAHGVVLTVKKAGSDPGKTGWAPFFDLTAVMVRKFVKSNAPSLKTPEHLSLSQIAEITLKMSNAVVAIKEFKARDLAAVMPPVKRTETKNSKREDPRNTTPPTQSTPLPPPESSQE